MPKLHSQSKKGLPKRSFIFKKEQTKQKKSVSASKSTKKSSY